ncbi:DUF5615 family PIN-like protein [Dehalococcoidia bacterium]|nr:DUF5615 family PIN-like protein [Dehalococcoidia bacterium]
MNLFFADECVSFQTVELIRSLGFQIEDLRKLGLRGLNDDEVFKIAQEKKAILVTYDKGFGNIRKFPPSSHNGVIVIKAFDLRSMERCHKVLERLLNVEREFKGTFFVVNQNKYRKKK